MSRESPRRLVVSAVGLVLLLAGVAAAAGQAPAGVAPDLAKKLGLVEHPNIELVSTTQAGTAGEATSVRQYWTRERRRDAKSLDLVAVPYTKRSVRDSVRAPETDGEGPIHVWSSVAPGGRTTKKTLSRSEAVGTLKGIETDAGGGTPPSVPPVLHSPFVYTRYRLFPDVAGVRTTYPNGAVGKLFFTIPDEGDFVCSASSVASENRSVVWTAGHCVATPGVGFHTNFLFVPAFHQHPFGPTHAPFGTWTVGIAVTLTGWISAGLFEYDLGALVMNRGGTRGLLVNDAVGGLGFVTHMPRDQHWHLAGYPAGLQSPPSPGPLFDGGHVVFCAASLAALDRPTGAAGDPRTSGVGCDQTGGSSGGPWVLDYTGSPGFNNLLNSNNSYRYVGCAPSDFCNLELYGPYFGDGAYILKVFSEAIFVP
jgi:V8-like Glu-specific endopeptidase